MKRKWLRWTCSNFVHHQHRWKWTAWICGRVQWLLGIGLCLLVSCQTYNSTLTRAGVSAGTQACLAYTIKDKAERTKIANWLNPAAAALYSITGNPTPEELTVQVQAFIPPNVQEDMPELLTFVIPMAISSYQLIPERYRQQAIPDIAYGLQMGTAPYVTKTVRVTSVTPEIGVIVR